MQTLVDGFIRFKTDVFPRDRKLFRDLSAGQEPHTLFITCSDSRVVPSLITQTKPGELFVCRTVGNQVPAYGGSSDGSVASAVEYSLGVLGVQNVVVCGHSDCGAMKAVLHPEKLTSLPGTREWLKNAAAARAVVDEVHGNVPDEIKLHLLAEENALAQLANLRTHPIVAARLARGDLQLHGWIYHIHSGEITTFDATQGAFVPLSHRSGNATGMKLAMAAEQGVA
jgi:carbonic anhydrase